MDADAITTSIYPNPTTLVSLSTQALPSSNPLHLIAEDLKTFADHSKDNFVINVPPSSLKGNGTFDIMEMTKTPAFNECAQLAVDANGHHVKLDPLQLVELCEHATVTIPSHKFPDQTHVWRITSWFLSGTVPNADLWDTYLAHALSMYTIHFPNLIASSKQLSMRNGSVHVLEGIRDLVDIFFGIPHLTPKYTESEVADQLREYAQQRIRTELPDQSFTIYDLFERRQEFLHKLSDPVAKLNAAWKADTTARRKKINTKINSEIVFADFLKPEDNITEVVKMENQMYNAKLFEVINATLNQSDANLVIRLITCITIFGEEMEEYNTAKKNAHEQHMENFKHKNPIKAKIQSYLDSASANFMSAYEVMYPISAVYKTIGN